MPQKAISPIIAIIIILLITIAIAGAGYSYISAYWAGMTGRQIEVINALCVQTGSQGKIMVKNIGTSPLNTGDIAVINPLTGEDITQDVVWTSSVGRDPNLVLELKFKEGSGDTASDSSNNNNAFSIGAVGSNVIWDNGIRDKALNYLPSAKTSATPCPTGAYLSVISSNQIYNLPQSKFTFTAWLKISAGGAIVRFNTQYNIPGCCNGFWIRSDSSSIANNAGSNTGIGISIPADNSWHHFAYVFDLPTNTHKTYTDGNLFQSASNLAGSYGSISKINLGIYDTHWCGAGHAMTGLIDDVHIYSRALSSDEIKALAENSVLLQPGETATLTHTCTGRCRYSLVLGGMAKEAMLEC